MNNINRKDYDCDECLIEALAKQQLLADLDAYVNFVEEEEWELAQDASLNAYEILQAFRDEDLTNWKKNNYDLIQDILSNNTQATCMYCLDDYNIEDMHWANGYHCKQCKEVD